MGLVPAQAYTCDDVRSAVATYGWARSVQWARANLSLADIRRAAACLGRKAEVPRKARPG